jgi:hypothetical protein
MMDAELRPTGDSPTTGFDDDPSLELAWQRRRAEEAKARVEIAIATSRLAMDDSAALIASAIRRIESAQHRLEGTQGIQVHRGAANHRPTQ